MLSIIIAKLGFILTYYDYGHNLMRSYSAPSKNGLGRSVLKEHEMARTRLWAAIMASK